MTKTCWRIVTLTIYVKVIEIDEVPNIKFY